MAHFDFDTSQLTDQQIEHLRSHDIMKLARLRTIIDYGRADGMLCAECEAILEVIDGE